MKHLLLITYILIFSASSALSMDLNEKIPHDLALKDQSAVVQSFESLSGENGLVLFFIRSVNWCPYCQAQLIDVNKHISAFEQRGYKVAALSYDPVGSLNKFSAQRALTFPLLSDPKSEAINAFGLLNTDIDPASPHYGIPNPAIVIIDKNKMIKTIHQENGYAKRPSLDKVLESLVY